MSFFCLRIPSRTPHDIVIVSLQGPLDWQFLRLPLFWWPWQFWGVRGRDFVECASVGMCLTFSPKQTEVMFFGEEDHRNATPITSRVQTIHMICPCWCWPGSPGWGHARQASPLFPHSILRRWVTKHSPLSSGEGEGHDWNFYNFSRFMKFQLYSNLLFK